MSMFMFRIDHKSQQAFWIHDPRHSAPAAIDIPHSRNRVQLMTAWAEARLAEEKQRDTDLRQQPPKPFYPMKLVLAVYPSRN